MNKEPSFFKKKEMEGFLANDEIREIRYYLNQDYTKKQRKLLGINRLILAVCEDDLEKCKKYHHLVVYPKTLAYFCKSIPIAAYFVTIDKKMDVAYASPKVASFLIKSGYKVPFYSLSLSNEQRAQLFAEASMTQELRRFGVCIIGLKMYKCAFKTVDKHLIKEIAHQVWESRFAITPVVTSMDHVMCYYLGFEFLIILILGIAWLLTILYEISAF